MNRIKLLFLPALILATLASCEIEFGYEIVGKVNEETSKTVKGAWSGYPAPNTANGITIVSSQRYTVDELFSRYASSYLTSMSESERSNTRLGFEAYCNASISDYDIPYETEKYWNIASVTYGYEGKTLPGCIIWCSYGPENTPVNPRYVVVDSHWTMTGDNEFPSKGNAPVIALAHMDAIYICPDQMAASEAQPYLCEAITASRTLGMLKAALGFFDDMGMEPLEICQGYSIGYSQGGASALAVHRAIEQDSALEQAIGFHGTYSGAGPYSMTITLNEWKQWSKTGDLAFPAAIGLIALGWDAFYADEMGANTAVNCFLSQAFRDSGALEMIATRSANIGSVNNRLRATMGSGNLTVDKLLAPDWDTNPSYKFMELAGSNDLLTGWTPRHPIVFFHSTEDEVVPYANSLEAIKAFPANLTTLHNQTGNHSNTGVQFYSWLGLQKGFPMTE